ncbi:MAG: adaptor protein MecA, partial [Lachnospiraceae bacterium]|nr:adaptor protein MecA [Lachnospiraceae bacterium]
MKIERVDDKTVKCYLSLEELEEYHVDYRDFLSRSEKAQRLMQEIIRQAREEVDYKPPKLAFEMQIMMVPDQG